MGRTGSKDRGEESKVPHTAETDDVVQGWLTQCAGNQAPTWVQINWNKEKKDMAPI